MKLVLLLFFIASVPLNALANWYVRYDMLGDSRNLIGDNEYSFELANVSCKVSESDSAYYYLRLRQADGHRAWLSPVWLDAVK